MSLAEQFNPDQAAQEMAAAILHRLRAQQNMPEAELQHTTEILFQFGKIAGALILQEQSIPIPNTGQQVPIDLALAKQILDLFGEGVLYSIEKCKAFNLPEDLKTIFLQNIAQHVFEQTKQVVVSTYGQEHTPSLQVSQDQQIQIIKQTAESALLYYISEHERQNGPLNPAPPISAIPAIPTQEQEPPPEETPVQLVEEVSPKAPVPNNLPVPVDDASTAITQATGPNADDKYAAIAMLLEILPEHRHASILKVLREPEREIVSFYRNMENIVKFLDIPCVLKQLGVLKNRLQGQRQRHKPKQGAYRRIDANQAAEALLYGLQHVSRPTLIGTFSHERSRLQSCLQQALLSLGTEPLPGIPLPGESAGGEEESAEIDGWDNNTLSPVMVRHLTGFINQTLIAPEPLTSHDQIAAQHPIQRAASATDPSRASLIPEWV